MTDAATGQAATETNTGAPPPSAAPAQPAAASQPAVAGLFSDGGNGSPPPANGTNGATPGEQGHNSGGHFDAQGNWREGFATGLDEQTASTWNNIASRYTSPADMAKAHVNLVQQMDKRVPLPGEDAKPEEWEQVWNKLGRPETPDKYAFADKFDGYEFSETDKQYREGFRPIAHKIGLTQRQVSDLEKWQVEAAKVERDAAIAKANTLSQQNDRFLRTMWPGEDFQRNRNLAVTTVKTYGDADKLAGMRLEDGTFVLDNPEIQQMLAKIGAERAEDDRDPSAFNTGARQNAKAQIEQIKQEAIGKGLTPSHPQWPHDKLDALYAKAYGRRNEFNGMPA